MTDDKYFVSPGLHAVIVDDERISVAMYGRRHTVKDESGLIRAILTAANDAGASRAALLAEGAGQWPADVIDSVLAALSSAGFLVTADRRTPVEAALDCVAHSARLADKILPSHAAPPAAQWTVVLMGSGELATRMAPALADLGLAPHGPDCLDMLSDAARATTLVVACADDDGHAAFRTINQRAVEQRVAALYLAVDAHLVRCGPAVLPKANACYECYYHRVNSTRMHAVEFEAGASRANVICHPVPGQVGLHWAVAAGTSQVLAIIAGLGMDLHLSPLQEIDWLRGEVNHSYLLKLPRCPVCGNASAARPFSPVINTKLALKAG